MKKKKKNNEFLKSVLMILIPIILCVGGYFIYDNYIKKPGIPSVNKLIEEKKKNGYPQEEEIDISNYENPLPGYRNQYGNSNIMGRLEIPNINIDSLIARTTNNEYYLNYNIYGQWDGLGMPFFDYRNLDLNNDKQINIYGHNTQVTSLYSQLPFTNLEAYMDEEIFKNYKDVYLSIDERQIHYEVVAIKIVDGTNNEHMKVIFSNDTDYLQHVNKVLAGTKYKSENADFTTSDRMLIMQICHYDPVGTYLLVICKEKNK